MSENVRTFMNLIEVYHFLYEQYRQDEQRFWTLEEITSGLGHETDKRVRGALKLMPSLSIPLEETRGVKNRYEYRLSNEDWSWEQNFWFSTEDYPFLMLLVEQLRSIKMTFSPQESQRLDKILDRIQELVFQNTLDREIVTQEGAAILKNLTCRVHFLPMRHRPPSNPELIHRLLDSIWKRRAVSFDYAKRDGQSVQRYDKVSVQRLMCYKQSWYAHVNTESKPQGYVLAAENISNLFLEDQIAVELLDIEILQAQDRKTFGLYNVYQDHEIQWAKLKIKDQGKAFLAKETWCSAQELSWDGDGNMILHLPYNSQDMELFHEIAWAGPWLEVMEPEILRQQVREHLQQALQQYQ